MILTTLQLEEVAAGTPFRFMDPACDTEFVVVRADVFERARRVLDDSDLGLDETRALMWQAMRDDWDDPSMDAYDALGAQ